MKLTILTSLTLAILAVGSIRAQVPDAEDDLESIYNYLKISDRLGTGGQVAYDQIESLKDAGYDVVVNLAPANNGSNALEGYLATEAGMTYVHIPVSWQKPSMRDLQMFFDVMEANRDRKVFVHCFANMRVSAFVYLYRTLVEGIDEGEARADLAEIWDPGSQQQWKDLIARAQSGQTSN